MGGARTSRRLKAQGRSRWCASRRCLLATPAPRASDTRRRLAVGSASRATCRRGQKRGAGHRSFLSGPYGDPAPRPAATAVTRSRLHGGLLLRRRAETPCRCVVARSSRQVREGRVGARAGDEHGYFPPAGGAGARDARLQKVTVEIRCRAGCGVRVGVVSPLNGTRCSAARRADDGH